MNENEIKIVEEKKNIRKNVVDFISKSMNGMAFGLLSTLIIGVIFSKAGELTKITFIQDLGTLLKSLMHVGIGFGVAWALKLDGMKLLCVGVSGALCSKINDPFVTYLVSIFSYFVATKLYFKKTPVDMIIIPLGTLLISYIFYILIDEPVHYITISLQKLIETTTNAAPLLMGILVAVLVGLCLTGPVTSAGIAIALNLSGLAGGAAVVGCCTQMLGFAVMSRKDNDLGCVLSIAFGTSKLQLKNVVKKPIIWLPTIIVSAILGALSTTVFKLECTASGAGMGTSGLVGQFTTFDAMGQTPRFWVCLIVLEFLLPIVLVYIVDLIFRKAKLISPGDLKI